MGLLALVKITRVVCEVCNRWKMMEVACRLSIGAWLTKMILKYQSGETRTTNDKDETSERGRNCEIQQI